MYEADAELVDAFLNRIEEMLSLRCYNFAGETLKGIHDFVDKKRLYTEKQEKAVDNIEKSHEHGDKCDP